MSFSIEIQEKIKTIFKNNAEVRDKLLSGDAETIREIGSISQRGIDPKDVIIAYESNDAETLNYLYKKAKNLVELQSLYKELCLEFCKNSKPNTSSESQHRRII